MFSTGPTLEPGAAAETQSGRAYGSRPLPVSQSTHRDTEVAFANGRWQPLGAPPDMVVTVEAPSNQPTAVHTSPQPPRPSTLVVQIEHAPALDQPAGLSEVVESGHGTYATYDLENQEGTLLARHRVPSSRG